MIFAGLCILALWLMPAPTAHRLQAAVRDTFTPFTALNRLRQSFARRPQESELVRLHEQIALLTLETRGLQALERENRELRRLLNLSRRMPYRIQAARVAMRDLTTWWQTARLDRGVRDGITPGMPVLAAEGLVGQVLEVSKRTADVTFLINPACRVAGMIPRVDAFGIVRGEGMSLRGPALCRMDFIARDTDISPGDEVVTSGLGGIFPPGLLIGYVRQTRQDATGLYQSAEILPAADFRNLHMVFLVNSTETGTDTAAEGDR
jgi:rod shape-determining protein MreC